MRSIIIKESNKEYPVSFNLESPYLKFTRIKVVNNSSNPIRPNDISLKFITKESNGGSSKGPISFHEWKENIGVINYIAQLNITESYSVILEKFKITSDIYVELFYENLPLIDTSKPFKDFQKHIDNLLNQKIMFSAPFGQGKSTFLDLYFEDKKAQYNVFKIYPVNYSIASNEDIFRYIKTDILYQLIDLNIDIATNDISFSHAAYELAILNKKTTIFGFIKLFTALGKNTRHLSNVIQKIESAFDQVKEHQSIVNKGELKTIETYLSTSNYEEGSIYEDNLYTQLIRDYLQQLKNNSSKKNVLLIEDLDRIDPDHIFRILNIISAHIDTYRSAGNEQPNKFDFDKIIIVSDIKNIEYIYEHRYGENVDFYGYLNKFFSTSPFYYDNNKVQKDLINEIARNNTNYAKHHAFSNAIDSVLYPLSDNGLLTLRELFKLLHYDIFNIISEFRSITNDNISSHGLFMPVIGLLLLIQSEKTLINKIEKCKLNKSSVQKHDINKLCKFLIAPLGIDNGNKSYTGTNNRTKFSFEIIEEDNYEFIFPKNTLNANHNNTAFSDIDTYKFYLNDFYDLFIMNIKKYQELYLNS